MFATFTTEPFLAICIVGKLVVSEKKDVIKLFFWDNFLGKKIAEIKKQGVGWLINTHQLR